MTKDILASLSIDFKRDGDASFKFDVNDDRKFVTTADLSDILLAKLISQLVGALLESDAMPEIRDIIEKAMQAEQEYGE